MADDTDEILTEEVVFRNVRLTVSEETILISMRRFRLQQEAQSAKETDPDRLFLHAVVYPNLVSATVEAEGIQWPLTFEAFLRRRAGLWDAWTAKVKKLNPHWYDTAPAEVSEEEQKKGLPEPIPSTSALPVS